MKIYLKQNVAYLWGDWTAAEMNYTHIDSLTALLDTIEAGGRKCLEIDCAHLNSIDDSGEHYLSIWLNCLKLRGIEYTLVSSAGKQEEAILYSEKKYHIFYHNPFERKSLTSERSIRRKRNENGRDQGYRPAEAG